MFELWGAPGSQDPYDTNWGAGWAGGLGSWASYGSPGGYDPYFGGWSVGDSLNNLYDTGGVDLSGADEGMSYSATFDNGVGASYSGVEALPGELGDIANSFGDLFADPLGDNGLPMDQNDLIPWVTTRFVTDPFEMGLLGGADVPIAPPSPFSGAKNFAKGFATGFLIDEGLWFVGGCMAAQMGTAAVAPEAEANPYVPVAVCIGGGLGAATNPAALSMSTMVGIVTGLWEAFEPALGP